MAKESSEGRVSVGAQIFAEVNELVAGEGVTRSEAFRRLSLASGRRPGTISEHYYRTARKDASARMTSRRRGVSGPHGSVGVMIFDEVNDLVAREGLKTLKAFERISAASGREVGTVSANYYRIARQRGVALEARRPRGPVRPGGPGRRAAGGGVGVAVAALTSALTELQGVVRRQDAELSRLRVENARFDEIRRLVKQVA